MEYTDQQRWYDGIGVSQSDFTGANYVYHKYKTECKRYNIDFLLTKSEFFSFLKRNCYYCGKPPYFQNKNEKKGRGFVYTGIDRYENAKGFVLGNCVPCCYMCNMMKSKLDGLDFETHLDELSKYRIKDLL